MKLLYTGTLVILILSSLTPVVHAQRGLNIRAHSNWVSCMDHEWTFKGGKVSTYVVESMSGGVMKCGPRDRQLICDNKAAAEEFGRQVAAYFEKNFRGTFSGAVGFKKVGEARDWVFKNGSYRKGGDWYPISFQGSCRLPAY